MGVPRFSASRTSPSASKHSSDKEFNVIGNTVWSIITYRHYNMVPRRKEQLCISRFELLLTFTNYISELAFVKKDGLYVQVVRL